MQTQMSFLIDSNVVITAEPFNGRLEELQPVVSTFLRIAGEHGHKVYVHPATLDDFKETSDSVHREQNIAAYAKYPALHEVAVPQHVLDVFPAPRSPNDRRARRATTNVKNLALLDVYGRVSRLLNELATDQDGARVVAEKLTHQDIAEPGRASREMVSRLLKDLTQGGYVAVRDRHIILKKPLPPAW